MYQVISSKNCCVLASLRLRSNSGKVPFFLVLFFGQTKKRTKKLAVMIAVRPYFKSLRILHC
jgi:hypothetical protein